MSDGSGLVSVVIVNWNTRDLVLQSIASVSRSCPQGDYEVIVVDNASSDRSAEAIRQHFPWVRLIENEANMGFAAANNQGAATAEGDFLLFLNPDTVVQEGAVRVMKQFLESQPDAGVVGCRILNPDGSLQPSYWDAFPSVKTCWKEALYLHDRLWKKAGGRVATGPLTVSHLLGACIMIRREVFERLGGFDERYFLYLEETDLCRRANALGKRNYYLPDAAIMHLGQQSSIQGADWTNVQLQYSTYAFIRRTTKLTFCSRMLLMLGMQVGCAVRLALWTLRFLRGRPDRRRSVRMLRGYWRLFYSIGRFEAVFRKQSAGLPGYL